MVIKNFLHYYLLPLLLTACIRKSSYVLSNIANVNLLNNACSFSISVLRFIVYLLDALLSSNNTKSLVFEKKTVLWFKYLFQKYNFGIYKLAFSAQKKRDRHINYFYRN